MGAHNKYQRIGPCQRLPETASFGALEQVFAFYGPMPTGVTVTEHRRIFVCFPQWGDRPACPVAELCGHKLIPYPNQASGEPPGCKFISVQSVVADWHDGLWVLDTAAPNFAPPIPGEAKLVKIALSPGGETLYFCPLSSRSLYSEPAAALRDRSIPEEGLAGLVETVAEKGASDGLAADAEGTVYAGDYESGSIRAISTDGG